MIIPTRYSGKTVAVFGLARSGLAATAALREANAHVIVWDDNSACLEALSDSEVEVTDLCACDFSRVDALVLSPGIPLTHPVPHSVVSRARAANCEVIGDLELFFRAGTASRLVGVTGTNGKSTTAALLGHIIRENGITVEVGGNIGQPALALETLKSDGVYVIEVSSYQIDLTPSLVCDVSILLNISADHLDRHGGMDEYAAIKSRIFNGRREERTAIVGIDDPYCQGIYRGLCDRSITAIPISVTRSLADGVYVTDGFLQDGRVEYSSKLDLRKIRNLRGPHNWQNSAAAYAAARSLGIEEDGIYRAISNYRGLPHRLETVAVVDGLEFINDSKATNVASTASALAACSNIYWIAGGQPKDDLLDPLFPFLDRVQKAYLIGDAADFFASELDSRTSITVSSTLEQAFQDATQDAIRDNCDGAVVLLSPACASFDQFIDYESRGELFRSLATEFERKGNV